MQASMSHRVLRDTVRKETSTIDEISDWAAVLWQKMGQQISFTSNKKARSYSTPSMKGGQHSASLIFASDGE